MSGKPHACLVVILQVGAKTNTLRKKRKKRKKRREEGGKEKIKQNLLEEMKATYRYTES